jgi:hypothetical protein
MARLGSQGRQPRRPVLKVDLPRLSGEDRAGTTGGRGQPLVQPSARDGPSWTARRRPASVGSDHSAVHGDGPCASLREGNEGLVCEPRHGEIVSLRSREVPMIARVNRQILLKSRPEGAPSLDNFTLKQGSAREPGDGEVLALPRAL